MSNASLPANPVVPVPAWDEDMVYLTLAEPARRRLLLSLARGGPQPASNLMGSSSRRLSATLKHLAALRTAGMVEMQENPGDGRKYLYAVSPRVPVVASDKGLVIEFGFLTVRL